MEIRGHSGLLKVVNGILALHLQNPSYLRILPGTYL